jgi:hypothetical protein
MLKNTNKYALAYLHMLHVYKTVSKKIYFVVACKMAKFGAK